MISLRMKTEYRLLGPQFIFLCLCLLQTAMAMTTAPAADPLKGVESLITELSSLSTYSAFRLFLQRAQALITGLVYVSVLVLPKNPDTTGNAANNTAKNRKGGVRGSSTSNSKSKKGGENSNTAAPKNASSRNNSGGKGGASEDVLPGATADGSDLEAWQRVDTALEQETACGLDWANSCIYELKNQEEEEEKINLLDNDKNEINNSTVNSPRNGVLFLAPEPEYPLPATAAFYAAMNSVEGIICNEYDALQ